MVHPRRSFLGWTKRNQFTVGCIQSGAIHIRCFGLVNLRKYLRPRAFLLHRMFQAGFVDAAPIWFWGSEPAFDFNTSKLGVLWPFHPICLFADVCQPYMWPALTTNLRELQCFTCWKAPYSWPSHLAQQRTGMNLFQLNLSGLFCISVFSRWRFQTQMVHVFLYIDSCLGEISQFINR